MLSCRRLTPSAPLVSLNTCSASRCVVQWLARAFKMRATLPASRPGWRLSAGRVSRRQGPPNRAEHHATRGERGPHDRANRRARDRSTTVYPGRYYRIRRIGSGHIRHLWGNTARRRSPAVRARLAQARRPVPLEERRSRMARCALVCVSARSAETIGVRKALNFPTTFDVQSARSAVLRRRGRSGDSWPGVEASSNKDATVSDAAAA